MAHEIDTSNGRNNIAYIGKKPWHGLGTELTEGESIDIWQKEAGLAWDVLRNPVRYEAGEHNLLVENKEVLFRNDTNASLGIVSSNYKIVQPFEVLDLYRTLADSYGAQMEVAGSLHGGKIIWCLARAEGSFSIQGDEVREYILFTTSYTGLSSTIAKHTSVRVVCNNTLDLALEGTAGAVRIPHSRVFSQDEVLYKLGLMKEGWEGFKESVTTLAEKQVTLAEAQSWLVNVFGDPELPLEEQPNARQMKRAFALFQGSGIGSQLPSARGTAWGLVNSATQLVDHNAHARSSSTRLQSAWMGDGVLLKNKAFNEALRLAA